MYALPMGFKKTKSFRLHDSRSAKHVSPLRRHKPWKLQLLSPESYVNDIDYFSPIGIYALSERKWHGVPKGFILRPLLVNIYMLPLAQIMENNTMCYHCYAEDTQGYIASPYKHWADTLKTSVIGFLQFNKDKTAELQQTRPLWRCL